MKASEVITSMRASRRMESTCEQRLLREGPPLLRQLVRDFYVSTEALATNAVAAPEVLVLEGGFIFG
jgi:hypothetical protein